MADDEVMEQLVSRLGRFSSEKRRRVEGVTLRETLAELVRQGGPLPQIRLAVLQAAKLASEEEAARWLMTLQRIRPQIDDTTLASKVDAYIRALRRRFGVRPSPDEVRAQTKERVRRFRARRPPA